MKKNGIIFISSLLIITNGLSVYFTIKNTLGKCEAIVYDSARRIVMDGKEAFSNDEVQLILAKNIRRIHSSQGTYQGLFIVHASCAAALSMFLASCYLRHKEQNQNNQGQTRKQNNQGQTRK
jgi:hypothetical protein